MVDWFCWGLDVEFVTMRRLDMAVILKATVPSDWYGARSGHARVSGSVAALRYGATLPVRRRLPAVMNFLVGHGVPGRQYWSPSPEDLPTEHRDA